MARNKRTRRCSTCIHWDGFGEDDSGACDAPVPDWAQVLFSEVDEMDRPAIAGDKGAQCPCYENGQLDEDEDEEDEADEFSDDLDDDLDDEEVPA